MNQSNSVTNDKVSPTTQLYSCLQAAFDFFNEHLFEGKLSPVVLSFDSSKPRTMAYYSHERWVNDAGEVFSHQITLNPSRFAIDPLVSVLSSLAHEQCHQYQYQYGTTSRAGYHNKEFSEIMEEIGLLTCGPNGKRVGQSMSHKIIPNGKFINACTALIKDSQFRLAWVDRQVGLPIPNRVVMANVAATAAPIGAGNDDDYNDDNYTLDFGDDVDASGEGDDDPTGAVTAAAPIENVNGRSWEPETFLKQLAINDQSYQLLKDDSLSEVEAYALLRPMAVSEGDGKNALHIDNAISKGNRKSKPKASGTRRKYVCSACETHVLGKQMLRIMCLRCDTLMIDQEEKDGLLTLLMANKVSPDTEHAQAAIYTTLRETGTQEQLRSLMRRDGIELEIDAPATESVIESTFDPKQDLDPRVPAEYPRAYVRAIERIKSWVKAKKPIYVDPLIGEGGGMLLLNKITGTEHELELYYSRENGRGKGQLTISVDEGSMRVHGGQIDFSSDGELGQIYI